MRFPHQVALFVLLFPATTSLAADVATLRNGFEIRHERRERIGDTTRLYFNVEPDSSYVDVATEEIVEVHNVDPPATAPLQKPQVAASLPLDELVNAASQRHLVDADLIASVIHAESNFNLRARSPKGAEGLMQLMPKTAARFGVGDPFQPEANIDAGSQYLRELLLLYDGDVIEALAAYNAGPARVAQYRGMPPYRETRDYVARVVHEFNCRKLPPDATAERNRLSCSSQSHTRRTPR